LTSVVCEALMVLLGIGVKVATLPVVALEWALESIMRCTPSPVIIAYCT